MIEGFEEKKLNVLNHFLLLSLKVLQHCLRFDLNLKEKVEGIRTVGKAQMASCKVEKSELYDRRDFNLIDVFFEILDFIVKTEDDKGVISIIERVVKDSCTLFLVLFEDNSIFDIKGVRNFGTGNDFLKVMKSNILDTDSVVGDIIKGEVS